MKLAKLEPVAVLCELTNEDGTMAKEEEIKEFAKKFEMPLLSVDDIKKYRNFIE